MNSEVVIPYIYYNIGINAGLNIVIKVEEI